MEEWVVVVEWKAAQFKEDMMDIDTIRYFGAAYVMESNLPPKEKCNMIDYIKEAEWDQILNLVFNGNPPSRKLTINEQYILEAQAENFIYPLILKYMTEAKGKKEKIADKQKRQQVRIAKEKRIEKSKAALAKKVGKKGKGKPKKITITKVAKEKPDIVRSVRQDTDLLYTKTKQFAGKGFESTKKFGKKIAPHAKRFAVGGSVVVVVAAATAAGHRVYKVFLSKAARQCRGLGGPEKRECIVKFRKAGYQAKLNSYIKARNDCRSTKDPQRCVRHIDLKIKRVKYKMGTLYSRL